MHGFGGHDGIGLGGDNIDCGCDHDAIDHSHSNSHDCDHDADHEYFPGITAEALMDCYDHHAFDHHAFDHHTSTGHADTFFMNTSYDGIDTGHAGSWSGVDSKGNTFDDLLQRASNDPDRRYFGAHVTGHGPVNLVEEFEGLATQSGLIRVCSRMANLKPVDLSISDNDISDWGRFKPPYTRQHTPKGYYEGADGLTWVFKQSWQLSDANKGFDRSQGTYLEVRIITWFFASIGDYESRIDVNVRSTMGHGLQNAGRSIHNHQLAAAKISSGLLNKMKAATPSKLVQEKRKFVTQGDAMQPAAENAQLENALTRFRNETRTESYKPANWFGSNAKPANSPCEKIVGVLVTIPMPRQRRAS